MPPTARLIQALCGRGKALVTSRGRALVSSRGRALVSSRGRALVVGGAAAALVGAGAASVVGGSAAGAATTAALSGSGTPASLAPSANSQMTAALNAGAGSGAQQPTLGGGASSFGSGQPYEIYDSVTPSAIPAGQVIATYANGPFAVSPAALAGKQVLWIDTNGSDPQANAVDAEPGDATPAAAGTWAAQKLAADPGGPAIIYTMESEWPAVQAAVRTAVPAAEQSQVRWWIADPTGVPHVVPGSSATQWYWGSSYDISTATPGF